MSYCALKVDISKAYDRVEWDFLWPIMSKIGFFDTWVKWKKLCVYNVNYSILVNGDLVGLIVAGHGLRQGNPISPYLLLICTGSINVSFD